MNKEEIKKIIPHREPMLLIDEAEVKEGKAYGKSYISGDEWFLKGHFPQEPVVPGVILCEMMGQACSVLLADKGSNSIPYFTGLNKVKFKNKVVPGDTLELECEIVRIKEPFYFARGRGLINGKLCVSGEFSFALIKEV
ncbi:MAG: 3-hydroxyacyl-ACP dehydratase FabZ [Bacillota bacterium]|jgi:3-hydroxyacyl-[acyl-carrier-protein] dehydratase